MWQLPFRAGFSLRYEAGLCQCRAIQPEWQPCPYLPGEDGTVFDRHVAQTSAWPHVHAPETQAALGPAWSGTRGRWWGQRSWGLGVHEGAQEEEMKGPGWDTVGAGLSRIRCPDGVQRWKLLSFTLSSPTPFLSPAFPWACSNCCQQLINQLSTEKMDFWFLNCAHSLCKLRRQQRTRGWVDGTILSWGRVQVFSEPELPSSSSQFVLMASERNELPHVNL